MLYAKIAKDIYCWAIAILYIVLVWLGWYMVGLLFFDRWYHDSLMVHKSLGMIMLVLVLLKIASILYTTFSRTRPSLRSFFLRYTHVFYLLAAIINVTGYLISTSAMAPIKVFRLFGVPAIVSIEKEALDAVIGLHYYLAYGSVLFVLAHALLRLRSSIRVRYPKR